MAATCFFLSFSALHRDAWRLQLCKGGQVAAAISRQKQQDHLGRGDSLDEATTRAFKLIPSGRTRRYLIYR